MLNQLTSFLTFIFKDMSKPILEPKTLKSVALTNSNTLQQKNAQKPKQPIFENRRNKIGCKNEFLSSCNR